ncbi:MAG: hypothetical protein D6E12_03605, partial [Desulfovibrio sp.]
APDETAPDDPPPAEPAQDAAALHEAVFTDLDWELLSGLARLHERGPELRTPWTIQRLAHAFGETPEEILAAVDQSIDCVPYHGSLFDPVQSALAGRANPLDRARLVAALLHNAGFETRIQYLPVGAMTARVSYAETSPGTPPDMYPELWQEMEDVLVDQVAPIMDRLTPHLLPAAQTGAPLLSAPLPDVFWVEARVNGEWQALMFSDSTVKSMAMRRANTLDEAALEARTWRVGLALTAAYADGSQAELLSFTRRSSQWHLLPVSLVTVPDSSLSVFTPYLLAGEEVLSGQQFPLAGGNGELHSLLLTLTVTGPNETREYTRPLLEPRTHASDMERGFEASLMARVSVVSGPVAEEDMASALTRNLAQAADLIFSDSAMQEGQPPLNIHSMEALSLMNASHWLAGRMAGASGAVLAFQARPALVIERDYVRTRPEGMVRLASLDYVDPGHGLAIIKEPEGPHMGLDELLLQAAVEHSIQDALLEAWLTDSGAVTSVNELARLMDQGADFAPAPSLGSLATDSFSRGEPAYFLAQGQNGPMAGWRLDPGPQVVPLLGDGTGGTREITEQRERLETICTAIKWASIFVPGKAIPAKPLLSGIAGYFCELARAYNEAADVLSDLSAMMDGEDPDIDQDLEDLKNRLEGLGGELVKGVGKGIATSAVKGLVTHAVRGRAMCGVSRRAGNSASRSAASRVPGVVGRASGSGPDISALANPHLVSRTLHIADTALHEQDATWELLRLLDIMARAGWTSEQRTEFFADWGSEANKQLLAQGLVRGDSYEAIVAAFSPPGYLVQSESWVADHNSLLEDLIEAHYAVQGQGREHMVPMRMLNGDQFQALLVSGELVPSGQGADWGYHGGLDQGMVAVRVKPGSEAYVEMVENIRAYGQDPIFWPQGMGNGAPVDTIPGEHLEYFDPSVNGWTDLAGP